MGIGKCHWPIGGCGCFVQSRYALGVCAACSEEFVGS
jgi:hypothetical protein